MNRKNSLKQKQIEEFWRKELSSPNLVYLLGNVADGAEELKIFFPSQKLDSFPEDWETFLEQIRKGFDFIARIRGKKHDALSAFKEIKARYELLISTDVLGESRRADDGGSETNQINGSSSSLSSKEKIHLKEIFNKLSSNPKAEPFLYPVDKSLYPEYYEVVSQPMDLTTWKKSIHDFPSVRKACEVLRLVWKNCVLFNLEESEISKSAVELAAETETIIQQRFGSQFTDWSFVREIGKRNHLLQAEIAQTKADFDVTLAKAALSQLFAHELAGPFKEPVREVDAPGYYQIIQHPVDLSLVKRKLKSGSYINMQDFIRDVNLVWDNCVAYNDPKSEIARNAKTLKAYFQSLLSSDIQDDPKGKDLKTARGKVMFDIINMLKDYRPYSVPFIDEVNEEEAPGYAEIVDRPMCLRKVEEKLKSKLYFSNPSLFVEDVKLIWQNCLLYNLPDSQICDWAKRCDEKFEELLTTFSDTFHHHRVLPALERKIQNSTLVADHSPEQSDLEETESGGKKSRAKVHFRERKFRTILQQLVSDSTISGLFSITAEQEPEKLSLLKLREECKTFIEAPQDFYSFMCSQIVTLRKGNDHRKRTELSSLAVSKLHDLFQRSFPNVPIQNSEVSLTRTAPSNTGAAVCNYDRSQIERRFFSVFGGAALKDLLPSEITQNFIDELTHRRASEVLKQTKLPFIVQPNLFEVQQFGEIESLDNLKNFYNTDFIFPVGFSNRSVLRLTLTESESGTNYPTPHVVVTVISRILVDKEGLNPIFVLALDNGVEICRSVLSPLDAWRSIFGKEQKVISSIGSKLKRCRAVLNRLCVSPDAVPFLEQIPPDDAVGVNYYRVVTSPMWLREVYNRLIDGTYDNEFDFAWDVRLVFRNCWSYNSPGSSIHTAASRLSSSFEALMADWVYNIQDRSVDDVAHGEWDDWLYLKYFDAPDPAANFCRRTGYKGKASEFLFCRWCEDQYLPSSIGLTLKSRSSSWSCSRCTMALENCDGDFQNTPKSTCLESSYVTSLLEKNVFTPAPELGLGWFQARRKGRGGLKNLFLSPLGYEVFSKEDIKLQTEFEEVIDKELMTTRAKEFKENAPERKRSHNKLKRSVASPNIEEASLLLPALKSRHLDEGRIVCGKLVDMQIPETLRWQFRIFESCGAESSNNSEWSMLNENRLKETGLFGLEIPDIVMRIEGLQNANQCTGYRFRGSQFDSNQVLEEFERHQRQTLQLQSAAKQVTDLLLKQRWQWEISKDTTSIPIDNSIQLSDPETLWGFKPLFSLSSSHENQLTEIMLVIWNYISSYPLLTDLGNVSFMELVNAFHAPTSVLSTIGQCVYDDVCSALTDYLLSSVISGIAATDSQEFFISHPVNCITWSKIAESVLISFSLPLNEDQRNLLMNSSLFGEPLLQLKAFTLFSNHPCVVRIIKVPEMESLFFELMERILLNTIDASEHNDLNRENFQDSIHQFLLKAQTLEQHENLNVSIAAVSNWFQQLMERFGSSSIEDVSDLNEDYSIDQPNWGCYTMRYYGFQQDDYFMSWELDPTGSNPYRLKLKVLSWLEKCLFLLGNGDSESWSTHDRVIIAAILVDFCYSSSKCQNYVKELRSKEAARFEYLSKDDFSDDVDSVKALVPKDAKCVISGICYQQLADATKWSPVPAEVQNSLKLPPEHIVQHESKYSMRHANFAVADALQSFIRCRENSSRDHSKYEVKVLDFRTSCVMLCALQTTMKKAIHDLSIGRFDGNIVAHYLDSQSIGYDLEGNSFWILRAQERCSLFSFDSNGRSFTTDKLVVQDPCILFRNKEGNWFYHDGTNIDVLFQRMSSLGMDFSIRLAERYLGSKQKLQSAMAIQPLQKIWIDRKVYLEKSVSSSSLYSGSSETHRCRQLEMQYARCNEARMSIYYSNFYTRNGGLDENSANRVKEYQSSGFLDYHPLHGWQNDGLKRLACSTIATRIHSDPTIASWIVQNMFKNSVMRKSKNVIPQEEQLEEKKESQAEVSQMPVSTPNVEAGYRNLSEYVKFRTHQTSNNRSKAVLQIHPSDETVLRIYPSGTDAAQSLNVLQSGISLCLKGLVPEKYGFRWKLYEGPPIEYDLIQHLQAPTAEMRLLQNTPDDLLKTVRDKPERDLQSKLVATGVSVDGGSKVDNTFSFPSVAPARSQSHIVTSTKTTSTKLIKLKSELFNILYSFPEKALKWPELDSTAENSIHAAGEAAYNNVMSASTSIQAVARESGQAVDIHKMAEKASRKARRRLRRKLAVEAFTKAVQTAVAPSDLLTQIIVLETAIPSALTYVCNRSVLPLIASTAADVAWRLYALDRSICYDEIQGIEHAAAVCPVKLRVCYSLRCHQSGNCSRYLGHGGKCTLGATSFSRLPDQFQIAPPSEALGMQSSTATHVAMDSTRKIIAPSQQPVRSQTRIVEESLPRLSSYINKDGVDIENITPWLPPHSEVLSAQWI